MFCTNVLNFLKGLYTGTKPISKHYKIKHKMYIKLFYTVGKLNIIDHCTKSRYEYFLASQLQHEESGLPIMLCNKLLALFAKCDWHRSFIYPQCLQWYLNANIYSDTKASGSPSATEPYNKARGNSKTPNQLSDNSNPMSQTLLGSIHFSLATSVSSDCPA